MGIMPTNAKYIPISFEGESSHPLKIKID